MRIITNLRQLNRVFFIRPVVSIGIFDGVHLGHKRILRKVVNEARRIGGTSIVVTFSPHPATILDTIGAPPLLISLKHRLKLIENEGIDVACVLNFNETLARCDAEEFVKKVLIKRISVRTVIIGLNFKFGKDKKGDIKLLKTFAKQFNFFVKGVSLFKIGGRPVSSTRIRNAIMNGRLSEAARLLGRRVSILGTVVKGAQRGRILGYPTANIDPHQEAIPPSGVYAVYVLLEGKRYKGILNIGQRPTFDKIRKKNPTIEVHIFNFCNYIYGKEIEVIFVGKLRGEKKFRTKKELVQQIKIDEITANMIL
ncbi:MAG: bifunctional riboflavin kinase/FAD synthetase [Candidatus Omnitrophica bacterium]|nr:bifunctional riboflavin kinase/FAD synthetase [Candidatus Omnitrophota bacterium]